MSADIVIVGSLNMDLVVRAPRFPDPGETIIGSDFGTFPGGKGANQAVAAARLGAKVKMIGCVGQDAFGDQLLESIAHDGVDTTFIRRDPHHPSGVALITLDEAGQNSIVVASGANAQLKPQDISDAEAAFEGASLVLLQLESPLDAVTRAVELAKQHGLQVVLNPAPARDLPPSLLRNIDYLIPNRNELSLLAGVEDIDTAVNLLTGLGIDHLIVTMGDEGVLVIDQGRQRHIPPYPVEVVDTTAAGDAFAGAFSVALSEGKDAFQAARWGNAAGALAVTHVGAQPSLPNREALQALMKA